MKEVQSVIEYKGEEYNLVFNLNVMQEIQEEYGSLRAWGELTEGKEGQDQSEPDIKALIFGLTAMLNEGIDIKNDEEGSNIAMLSKKKVGRMLTEYGVSNMTKNMNDLVIESTKSEEKNA